MCRFGYLGRIDLRVWFGGIEAAGKTIPVGSQYGRRWKQLIGLETSHNTDFTVD